MYNLQQISNQAARTTSKNYMLMISYAVFMFCLAVVAGLTYEHYQQTKELLPLQWFGIDSPKETLKKQTVPVQEKQP